MSWKESKTVKDPCEVGSSAGTVTIEPLHNLTHYWQDAGNPLKWDCLFMLPPWLSVWWSYFGQVPKTHLYVVKQHEMLIGLAPFVASGDTVYLISDTDMIDYSDFIVAPSREREFFLTLFDYLRGEGIYRLEVGRIREDSAAISYLKENSTSLDCHVSSEPVDVLFEMDFAETWEEYLDLLSGKERHETRRKLRRLESAGQARLRIIENEADVSAAMDTFIALFRSNRIEKAQFMTGPVESFFRSLAIGMVEAGLLKLFFLDLNDAPAAVSMCFDYNSMIYLYNNGYDRRFSHLSVGLLNTLFSIRESIMLGRKKYNLLRGSETYKGRLGGYPVKLHHYEVILR